MYKSRVLLAFLVVVLASFVGRSASVPTPPASPVIVAQIRLTSQTAPIPTTTLFTPTHNGLYRVSAYMTITSPGPNGWALELNWTDGAGLENAIPMFIDGAQTPPAGYGSPEQGNPFVIEAVAGTPVSYYVVGSSGSTYDLFLVVERLE